MCCAQLEHDILFSTLQDALLSNSDFKTDFQTTCVFKGKLLTHHEKLLAWL